MSLQRFNLNKEIAEFVVRKQLDGTPYTQEDVAYINQYVGYGGMWKYDDTLEKERGLYEYYTPSDIVGRMASLAFRDGYKGGPVLEPSCGIGRFLHYFPSGTDLVGIELDHISSIIARVNFPKFQILHQSFNNLFVDRRGNSLPFTAKYQLVIGNPPYGDFAGKGTQVEKRITKANTYVDYFITRGLDLLLPGGLLIYIIPSAFLDGTETDVKREILEKAELLEAFRLPKGIFDATEIQTDIVVFRKK